MPRARRQPKAQKPCKPKGERGRPLVDRRIEYSEDHRCLLAYCAMRANRAIAAYYGYTVPPPELMAEGWWKCLRRLKAGELNRGTDRTIRDMIRYGKNYHWNFYSYPWANEDHRSSEAEQAIPAAEDSFATIDTCDELSTLLAGIDPVLVEIGMCHYGHDLTWQEVGKRFQRSGEWARQRGVEFLQQARQRLLERPPATEFAQGCAQSS